MATKKKYQDLGSTFSKMKALIIGDVMIDKYLWGKVDRISPEAPVPVVSVRQKESRLGGAANVAINVQSLGATPLLCSVIGADVEGRNFIELMHQQNMNSEGIFQSTERPTTVKTRVIGNNYQMLRVDEEFDADINANERKQLLTRITAMIRSHKPDVVIFEDYDKGVLGKTLITQVIRLAKQHSVPVAADPKKKNFTHYRNISLLKPNLKELNDGLKSDLTKHNLEGIAAAAKKLSNDYSVDTVLITLSEKGVFLHDEKNSTLIPAHVRNIADVSGAGDTVISVASLCLAAGMDAKMAAATANLAGGLVCEKVGVVPVALDQLEEELKSLKL